MVILTTTVQSVLTRAVTLHARHRYHRAQWTEAENRSRFGSAGDAGGHGHLYRVEISVTGPLDGETQMVVDLPLLDRIIAEQVVGQLDGQSLNEAVPAFATGDELPSCEALARWVWMQVSPRLPGSVRMHRVRVAEDETLWAECIADRVQGA